MKKIFLWLLIVSMIAVFSLTGCKAEAVEAEIIKEKPVEEPAEEVAAEESVVEEVTDEPEEALNEPEEEETAEEAEEEALVEEGDNNGNTEIEYEIIYTLMNIRLDGGITYYVLIDSIDLSDDTFKDNIKEIIRKVVEEKGKKISIEIFDKRSSLENGYKDDKFYAIADLKGWENWITDEILNDLAIHSIASYDGELENSFYFNTLWFFTYSDSGNTENPEIDDYVEIIEFNPSETKEETTQETFPVIEDKNVTIEAENRYLSEITGIVKGINVVYEDFGNSINDYNKGFLTLEGIKADSIEFYAGVYAAVYAFDSLKAPVPESFSVLNWYFSKYILEWEKTADHMKNFVKSTSNKDMHSELKAAFDCIKAANGYMEAAEAELNKLKQ